MSSPDNSRFTWGDSMTELPPMRWLIEGVIPKGDIGMIYGPTQNCKSFLALDIACHVATDRYWNNCPVSGGRVLYIAAEAQSALERRFHAWKLRHRMGVKDICFYNRPVALWNDRVMDEFIEQIDTEFGDRPPALIVVDTYHKCMAGKDENTAGDTALAFNNLERLKDLYGSTIILVHHPGRGGNHPRGSSSIDTDLDFLYSVSYDKPNRLITMGKEKMRGDDDGVEERYLRTETIYLPDQKSCLVLEPGEAPVKRQKREAAVVPSWSEQLRAAKGADEWTVAEAVEITGLSKSKIYQCLKDGRVEKVGSASYRLG